MVSRNDPGEALFNFNSLNAVKGMLSPLELGIGKATKDFECCWSSHDLNKHMDLSPRKNGEVQIFPARKKNEGSGHDDVKKKGLSFRVPVEAFKEIIWPRCGNFEHNRFKVSKKGSKEKSDVPKEQPCTKCMNLAMTWSVLVAGLFQAFLSPFKVGKKRVQKMSNKDGKYPCFNSLEEASRPSSDEKKDVHEFWVVEGIQDDDVNHKDSKHILWLIGLAVEQVAQNFQKSDECVKGRLPQNSGDKSSTHKDHFNIVSNIIKGRKLDVRGFLRNFNLLE